jgi:kinetochore protein Spc25, fungi type
MRDHYDWQLTQPGLPVSESQHQKRKSLELLAQKSSAHAASLAKEATETSEMHAAIQSVTTQHSARLARRDALRAEINQAAKQVAQRIAAQEQYARAQAAQARLNTPELAFWEVHLCLRIEGVGKEDRLRFVFTHVDERDWEREAWFELDTERRDYRVVGTRPKLEGDVVEACVERLNESRELGQFLGGMSGLFVKTMK